MFGADYDVYNFLINNKSDDKVLNEFNIEYPSSSISVASNTIFVGLSEAKPTTRTHHSQKYNELVDIVISTKQANYTEAMKIFRSVAERIMKLFRASPDFNNRFNVISFIPKYLSDELKYAELLISVSEVETFPPTVEDEDLIVELITHIKEE
jgi:uncharacterized protein YbgA (DUF1722 family)